MAEKTEHKLSEKTKKEIFMKYYCGTDIWKLTKQYGLDELEIIHIVTRIENDEHIDLRKWLYKDDEIVKNDKDEFRVIQKKCKFCRWRPCTGAPCCYKDVIDGGRNL